MSKGQHATIRYIEKSQKWYYTLRKKLSLCTMTTTYLSNQCAIKKNGVGRNLSEERVE